MKNNIILIGFMGTGKSAVGAELASLSGLTAVDTDTLIVEQQGKSIPLLFAEHGEPYFRQCEHEVLAQVLTQDEQIISTGGGAVLAEKNRQLMQDNGFVVSLFAHAQTIIDRIANDQNRPLIAGNVSEKVYNMLEQRQGAYAFAHLEIDTTDHTIEEVAKQIWQAKLERVE